MNRFLPALIVALVLILLFILMWRAWRSRRRSTPSELWESNSDWMHEPPQETITRLFYVATTRRNAPLERVLPPGLAYRGNATIDVHPQGIVIHVTGERPYAIERAQIERCSVQQVTIDKVVERDGLVAIEWTSKAGPLSSVFRAQHPESRRAVLSIFQPTTHTGDLSD